MTFTCAQFLLNQHGKIKDPLFNFYAEVHSRDATSGFCSVMKAAFER